MRRWRRRRATSTATHIADSFFVASSYLSTATVLYKRGGFTADEIAALRKHTHDMSFDEIYSPGFFYDGSQTDRTLDGYVAQIFSGAGRTARRAPDAKTGGRPDRAADDGSDAPGGRRSGKRTTACCRRPSWGASPGTR